MDESATLGVAIVYINLIYQDAPVRDDASFRTGASWYMRGLFRHGLEC